MSRFPTLGGAGQPAGPPAKMPFAKPWLNWSDQLAILRARGLVVTDPAAAEAFLSHVNYYRLSGYCLAFEQSRHVFLPGTTFEQVRAVYDFDWTLRDLITEAAEIVEVDVRTAVAYHFGQQYGAFGHTTKANFDPGCRHHDWLQKLHEEATRSSELFVKHFEQTYIEFPALPIWMATEVMSFGSLSLMYKGMLRKDQHVIARRYGLHHSVLPSWLHHIVYVRNTCAHHSRLWDRSWQVRPVAPKDRAWASVQPPNNNTLFITLLLLRHLLTRCSATAPFATQWKGRIEQHLAALPPAPNPSARMGLPQGWITHPLWT
jgi:abortive infection bacteriophage resistance protein